MLKRIIYVLSVALLIGCQDEISDQTEVNVSGIVLETFYSVHPGDVLTFASDEASLPVTGDLFRFVSEDRSVRKTVSVDSVHERSFSVVFPDLLESGVYILYLVREERGYRIGEAEFEVLQWPESLEERLEEGTTVWGTVTCGGVGVAGVAVSDGCSVTLTDEDGVYGLKSLKTEGTVFVSVPDAYKMSSDNAIAVFYSHLVSAPEMLERVDFTLSKSDGVPESLIVLGDIHLAGINNDVALFEEAMADVSSYVSGHPERRFTILTLGDMTWDSYWYSTPYGLVDYVALMNRTAPSGVPVFNTIGNHDHDQNAVGDVLTALPYKRILGPTRYSFNHGGAHVMVIDDVECTNSQASTTDDSYRSYRSRVMPDVLEWITEDLKFVETDKPLIVAAHCPIYKIASTSDFTESMENASEFLNCFKGRRTYFITGHNHTLHNVDRLADGLHYEHNAAAVCAAWWQTRKFTSNNICADGTPGGYSIYDLDESGVSWRYKPVGADVGIQFRAYDLNSVDLVAEKYIPQCTDPAARELWDSYVSQTNYAHKISFAGRPSDNSVLINVWNWDEGWNLTVKEKGRELSVKRIRSYDPLFLVSYVAPRLNLCKSSNINPKGTNHMFLVQASSADSNLEVVVTDRFGNISSETIERPMAFSIDAYEY